MRDTSLNGTVTLPSASPTGKTARRYDLPGSFLRTWAAISGATRAATSTKSSFGLEKSMASAAGALADTTRRAIRARIVGPPQRTDHLKRNAPGAGAERGCPDVRAAAGRPQGVSLR